MEKLAPIHITFMIAFYTRGENAIDEIGEACWHSQKGLEVRRFLIDEGLIDSDNGHVTDRGEAWVDFICSTPLPEMSWTLPKREAA